jgi:hypothetical protein
MSDFHFSPRPNRAGEIRWRDWDDESFAEARKQEKPILLAISAVWCHWCHVMDETTYSSPEVIDTINRSFIPIRVDNDRRPDVNARYNQGGWPTTAVLTPEGELLKGATYVPPEQMHDLLIQIDRVYADPEKRLAIANQIRDMRTRRGSMPDPVGGPVRPDVPDRVFSFIDASFDEVYAGFGDEQKFPQTNVLHFLLDFFARRRDRRASEMTQRTLRAMASGGMYDRVEGGFFRYSTTRNFSVPHFEKMLEDLGGLLLACARSSAMFADPELGRIACEVRSYLDARLWNENFGAYGGSQDADEEYYARDARGRLELPRPYVDPIVYASWNAETARALIISGPLVRLAGADVDEWTARGVAVLDTLWSKMVVDGMMCRYFDGAPHVRGLLGDQAWSAWAALAAFEATGDRVWLSRAQALVEAAEILFDAKRNSYADRPTDDTQLGRLAETSTPFDENAVMARVCLNLGAVTGEPRWPERARAILEAGAESYRSYGRFAAGFGSAALDILEPPIDLKIVGRAQDGKTAALRGAARRIPVPAIRIDSLDPLQDLERLAALGQVATDTPTAYLCGDGSCFARVTEPGELESRLSHASSR